MAELLINARDRTVVSDLRSKLQVFANTPDSVELRITTAYFNVAGFELLADLLDQFPRVRLLIGAEPVTSDPAIRSLEAQTPGASDRALLAQALRRQEEQLFVSRDLLGFSRDAIRSAQRLVDWLSSGRVEVRRLTDRFLHGKLWLLTTPTGSNAVVGSSNFTYAGLTTNLELNLQVQDLSISTDASQWFDALWELASPYDLAAQYAAKFEPFEPWLIYLRMLWEQYRLQVGKTDTREVPTLGLTDFQKDAQDRAIELLRRNHGVLIADEVGLGKSMIALALLQDAKSNRHRSLLVVPAVLRDSTWKKLISQHDLGTEIVSYEELVADSQIGLGGTSRKLAHGINDYQLVIVDEAHNLRNPDSQRAVAVERLLAGSPPKDVVLMTATPVNNSLWDLYSLLRYFIRNDSAFLNVGIRSLREKFQVASAVDAESLSPEILFDVLDATAIRRTRRFIHKAYPRQTIDTPEGPVFVKFPEPRVRRTDYECSDRMLSTLDLVTDALGGGEAHVRRELTMARYRTAHYLLDQEGAEGEVSRQDSTAGLVRSTLLKRFESSAVAFRVSLERLKNAHDFMLQCLQAGKIPDDIRAFELASAEDDEATEELLGAIAESMFRDAREYDVRSLETDLRHDLEIVTELLEAARALCAEVDPKLRALHEILEEIATDPVDDRRKVLIFTSYKDTAVYLEQALSDLVSKTSSLARYQNRVAVVAGSTSDRENVAAGFAPKFAGRIDDQGKSLDDDLTDVLVATDVLAEGVNLQQCRNVVNFDLPWNPMRLVQRHGRIDRIKSPHDDVDVYCFFPATGLDALLGLEERITRKVYQAANTIGQAQVLPDVEGTDRTWNERREQIEQLRSGDATLLESRGTGLSALGGEEFRQTLSKASQHEMLRNKLSGLPWGVGSGISVPSQIVAPHRFGYVFCARVGDSTQPQFRFVQVDRDGDSESELFEIERATLRCLSYAMPPKGEDEPRVVSDELVDRALDAWELARADIVEQWNFLSDSQNLRPRLEKGVADAVEFLRTADIPGVTHEIVYEQQELIEQNYPRQIALELGYVVRSLDKSPSQKFEELQRLSEKHRMVPRTELRPKAEITKDDVYLICWMGLSPQETP